MSPCMAKQGPGSLFAKANCLIQESLGLPSQPSQGACLHLVIDVAALCLMRSVCVGWRD